jgi:hypothetical protein
MLRAGFKGSRRPIAALAVALVMSLAVAASASAATVTVTPHSGLSASGTTSVTVRGSGFSASTDYRLGECSNRTYGIFGVPACGRITAVRSDGSGAFSTTIDVQKEVVNVHAGIMPPFNGGQPARFTCLGSSGDQCAVWAVSHSGTPTLLASQNITFN